MAEGNLPPPRGPEADNAWRLVSYSQEGEDILLRYMFPQDEGVYVDVGAHHPVRFSNTLYFYNLGWRGINIDPVPGVMALFEERRPGDVNLELGVARQPGVLEYHAFTDPAFNSFNAGYADSIARQSEMRREVLRVPVDTLVNILDAHLGGHRIDFMTIDTEEYELEVLASNDWERYRPSCLVVESLCSTLARIDECPIYRFLSPLGYEPVAKTIKSTFYRNVRSV
ncbi:MAG: hypothetical protein AUJ49_01150 [Desulfovibrionaceae bacterium CG1_02_65_16]|nr:MAG: hypothetical protein AUJ49_01150 [Desulfovibrionaceae bacterium CG1_02_65_16]